jgi:hypothetical protein
MNKLNFKIAFFFFLALISLPFSTALAQKKAKKSDWLIDLSRARSSFSGVVLEKIELRGDYTIAYFTFINRSVTPTYIEACNSFFIGANGKKVAKFVRAEGIATRDVIKNPFQCADESGLLVQPLRMVRFKVYFTRISEMIKTVDIIEYNGRESCEFDIYDLDISERRELEPAPALAQKTKPKTKPNTQKPPRKYTPESEETPPTVASKTPTKPKEIPKETPKETIVKEAPPAQKPTLPPVESRKVVVRKAYELAQKTLRIEIWDNAQEDNDKVSLMLNNRWILQRMAVTKQKRSIEIPLKSGTNTLVFHAEDFGILPPCTATLSFFNGDEQEYIVLESDANTSQAVTFVVK